VQQTYDFESYGHVMFTHFHLGKFKLLCHITHEIITNNFSKTIFQPYIVLYATIDEQLNFQLIILGCEFYKLGKICKNQKHAVVS
jgi:hypothetical protein